MNSQHENPKLGRIRAEAEARTTPAMSDNDKLLQPCTVDRPVRLTAISDDRNDACKKKPYRRRPYTLSFGCTNSGPIKNKFLLTFKS
jgi:hypothetical protein